eukprot:s318_g6.t1
MCLRWATTCGCNLSPRTIQAITVLINVVGLVNRRDLPQLFVPANYAGRFFIGSFSPDPTFAAWVNFLLLPAFVAVGCSRLPQGSWVDCLGIFVNEVIVVVFMVCVLGQINSTTYQQEVATMEKAALRDVRLLREALPRVGHRRTDSEGARAAAISRGSEGREASHIVHAAVHCFEPWLPV